MIAGNWDGRFKVRSHPGRTVSLQPCSLCELFCCSVLFLADKTSLEASAPLLSIFPHSLNHSHPPLHSVTLIHPSSSHSGFLIQSLHWRLLTPSKLCGESTPFSFSSKWCDVTEACQLRLYRSGCLCALHLQLGKHWVTGQSDRALLSGQKVWAPAKNKQSNKQETNNCTNHPIFKFISGEHFRRTNVNQSPAEQWEKYAGGPSVSA